MSDPYIVVNEYLPTGALSTGHTNISFYDGNNNLLMTIGANIHNIDLNPLNGMEGGIYNETNPSRVPDYTTRYDLSNSNFLSTYGYAVGRVGSGSENYFLVGSNCVDFVHSVLEHAGVPHDLSSMFHGTALDAYATTLDFLVIDFGWLSNELYMNPQENLFQQIDYHLAQWDSWNFQEVVTWFDSDGTLNISSYLSQKEDNEEEIHNSAYSPIIIDLDRDGVETTRFKFAESNPNVSFDIDGDGVADEVAWAGADDAFLVVDLNNDGLINSGLEMFGGANRGDGFAKLATLDDNLDGVLNALDASFASLMLWNDANSNGVTDQGELQYAASMGLTQIDLDYKVLNARDHGNLLGEGSTAWINGAAHAAIDVYFQSDLGNIL